MICRLPQSILHRIARYVLVTSSSKSRSWFSHIRTLCSQYQLPHPLVLLDNPLTKSSFKSLVKSKVQDYWECKLRQSTLTLSSLSYFHPDFMSLTTPHPLLSTCGSNSFEVSKSVIVSRIMSGRYRSDKLLKHFDKNHTGQCSLCTWECEGSIEHLLVSCPALMQCRQQQFRMLEQENFSEKAKSIILSALNKSVPHFIQLLLDCSALPEVISAVQSEGKQVIESIFKFSRTYCFNVHMNRMKIIGRFSTIIRIMYTYCKSFHWKVIIGCLEMK